MTLERILEAAKNSMINGHHAAHCYSAHVVGRGYVNDGSLESMRADYLKSLARDVQAEIDNMGYAPGYAERGYEQPKRGVLLANWNRFPRDFDRVLERAGYAVEWRDEWTTCDDCGKAFRTQPDSYVWTPSGEYCERCSGDVCNACHEGTHDDDDE